MEESTDGNLDLLSAALNQSGLMGFDLPDAKGNSEQTNDELTLGLHNDPLLNALNTVSPGLLLSQVCFFIYFVKIQIRSNYYLEAIVAFLHAL